MNDKTEQTAPRGPYQELLSIMQQISDLQNQYSELGARHGLWSRAQ